MRHLVTGRVGYQRILPGLVVFLALGLATRLSAEAPKARLPGVGGLIKQLFSKNTKPAVPEMTSHATDQATRRRLAEAQRLLEEDRGGPALTLLQSVLDEPENSYIELDDGRWVSIAEATEQLIVESGPEFVAEYRRHYEDQAALLLRQALARNEPSQVALVVRRFFLTRSGFEAANHLASFHLDVGQPGLAVHILDRLLANPVHRDEVTDVMRAKRAAALALVGQQQPARFALEAIGEPSLRLGGERRVLDRLLVTLEGMELDSRIEQTSEHQEGFTPLLAPAWSHPLTELKELEQSLRSILDTNANGGRMTLLESRPLVVGDVVLFRDFRGVWAYDARSGKKQWHVGSHIVTDEPKVTSPRIRHGALSPWHLYFTLVANGVHGTLSTDGERVFFIDELTLNPQVPAGPTRLVAVDIASGEVAWSMGARSEQPVPGKDEERAYFYGPPLAYDGKLYLLGESRSEIRLLCLESSSGRKLWSQPIATAEYRIDNDAFRRSQLSVPIAAHGLLLCQTNLFRLVAFDPVSQSVLWHHSHSEDSIHRGRRSHSSSMLPPPSTGAATDPPIVVDDKVILASPTGKSIRCLDLFSGTLRWRIERDNDIFVAGSWKDLVVLAGGRYVRAVGVADGRQRWKTDLPLLSGRGAFVGNSYLIPVYDGRIIGLDLTSGKQHVVARGRGRPPLGNLVSSSHGLLATGIHGLETLPWRHHVDREVQERLAANINDPLGLLNRAQLRLADDEIAPAVRDLFQAMQTVSLSNEQRISREILFDIARHEALTNPEVAELLVDRLLPLSISKSDEGIYYRLLAEYHRRLGNFEQSLDAVGQHKELLLEDSIRNRHDDVGRSPRTWVRAFHRRLIDEADEASRRRVLSRLSQKLIREPGEAIDLPNDLESELAVFPELSKEILDEPSTAIGSLKELAFELAGLPVGRRASMLVAAQLAKEGAWTEAQQHYLEAATADDDWLAAEAIASLVNVAQSNDRIDDARHYSELLSKRYATIPITEGQTGAELHASFLERHGKEEPKRLEWGEFGGARLTVTKVTRAIRTNRYLQTRDFDLPFFTDHHFQFDLSRYELNVLDRRTGKSEWLTKFEKPRFQNWGPSNVIQSRSSGHLFFFCVSSKVYAFSGLQKKQLWSRFAAIGREPNEAEDPNTRPRGSWFSTNRSSPPPNISLGPAGPGFLCIRSGKELMVVDSLTGQDLWTRKGLPDGATVFGDQEVLFVLARDGSATVHRTLDGTVVRRDEKDRRLVSRRDFNGRRVLLTVSEGSDLVIRLWDPWLKEEVWARRFPRTSRYFLGREHFLAVLAPDGQLTVMDRRDGQLVLQDRLEQDDLRKVRVINVFSDDDRYYVAHDFRFGNHVRYMHPTANLVVATVNGPLRAYERETGKRLWDRKLEGRTVIVGPRIDLPILFVFESRIKERVGGTRQLATRIEVLSKKDGSTLAEKEYDEYTSFAELVHDVAERWIELRSWNVTVRVDLLTEEEAKKESRGAVARGWLESIKQFGDWIEKQRKAKAATVPKEPKP